PGRLHHQAGGDGRERERGGRDRRRHSGTDRGGVGCAVARVGIGRLGGMSLLVVRPALGRRRRIAALGRGGGGEQGRGGERELRVRRVGQIDGGALQGVGRSGVLALGGCRGRRRRSGGGLGIACAWRFVAGR